jgi:starch synthase
MRILFAASEAYPLIKTGGLADVCGSLPRALTALGHDVRLLLPAYREAVAAARAARTGLKKIAAFDVRGDSVAILETRLPGSRVKTWLVDCPRFFDRPGNPYHDSEQRGWPDNDVRFLLFCRSAAQLALDRCGLGWAPDIVHCNDWHTGLVPALLSAEPRRPATLFTIHNLAYQGLFDYASFQASGLADSFWSHHALEFHGRFSYIKGGLVYADRINTVSPHYAGEIQTEAYGHGLDGLLRHRREALTGILNGIDTETWNPGRDPHLARRYNSRTLDLKAENKSTLQQALGLRRSGSLPLLGFIGRLVEQKGIDLMLASLPHIVRRPAQIAVLGSGAPLYETALRQFAAAHPAAVSVTLGYDEPLAHRIEAGADLLLMPSRFEPCGLNQMYSLRYGTVPVVHRVGGLADTVLDPQHAPAGTANGFSFTEPTPAALLRAVDRALAARREPQRWRQLQLRGMRRDFSWRASAAAYQNLYEDALRAAGRARPSE